MSERIYYDGTCGVCHWSVRFVARRDPEGELFRFAPLGGSTFQDELGAHADDLPDSIAVPVGGALLVRSAAVVHILRRLGGAWRLLGHLLWCVPRPLRDLGYDLFARIRHRLVPPPEDGTCPLPPDEIRGRLDP